MTSHDSFNEMGSSRSNKTPTRKCHVGEIGVSQGIVKFEEQVFIGEFVLRNLVSLLKPSI